MMFTPFNGNPAEQSSLITVPLMLVMERTFLPSIISYFPLFDPFLNTASYHRWKNKCSYMQLKTMKYSTDATCQTEMTNI